jgi:hypothetical protein
MTASETQETLSSRITLLGGEMLNWSDLDRGQGGGRGPFASPLVVPVLSQLLRKESTALIVGPTAPWLLERFSDLVGSLDIVVRSWPDAHALNLRLNGKPVRIFCGGFEKFKQPAGHYDVVLALDGIPRAFSADSRDMPWLDALHKLRDLVRPGGKLVLGVTNGMGLDAILDADRTVKPPTDDMWATSSTIDLEAPPGLDAVRAALTSAGLSTDEHYAVYPEATKTSLMVHERVLSGHTGDEVLGTMTSAAFAHGLGGRPVLTDPRRMAREMMRYGTGLSLAPGWLFVTSTEGPAGSAAAPDDEEAGGPAVGFPDALITDNLDYPYWSVVSELTRDADGHWSRELVNVGRSTSNRASGHLQREPAKLSGAIPGGALIEEQFLTAARHDDLKALRRLVRAYAQWLHDQAELRPWTDPWAANSLPEERLVMPGEAVFATFENVMYDGNRLALLDASWNTTLQVPYEFALTRALRRFGYRLLAGGLRHPWPSGMSPNRLTVTMAAMVGVTVTPHMLERSARLEVELEGQQRNNTEAGDQQLYFELQTMGEQPMGTEPGQPRGYREALATVGRLSTELAEAQSQIEWLDKTVQLREDQLRKERRLADDVKNSVSFAIGRGLTAPFRLIFRAFRPIFRAMNPGAK